MHQRCKDMKYHPFLQALSQLFLIATRNMKRYKRGMPPFLYLFFLEGMGAMFRRVKRDFPTYN